MSHTVIDTFSFISIAILWILCLICMLWLCSFYLLRNNPQISSRKPTSSIYTGTLCVIGLAFTYPLTTMFLNTTSVPDFKIQWAIISVLILCTNSGLYHIFTYRAFMVYFDIKWNQALQNQEWRLYISPEETNCFLKHRNTWGNAKRIGIILFTHLLIWALFVFVFLLSPHSKSLVRAMIAGSGLLPIICDIILYIIFPKFDDLYGITREIKWTLSLELFTIFILSITSYLVQPKYQSFMFLLFSTLSASSLFIYVYIMHYQCLKNANLPTNPWMAIRYLKEETFVNKVRDLSVVASPEKTEQKENVLTLKQTLSDTNGFNNFAVHLTKEFCVENLLFLVETEQWLLSLNLPKNETNEKVLFKFPKSAPISEIVQIDDIYVQCAKLFMKYVSNKAYFCINVSSKTRSTLYTEVGYNENSSDIMSKCEEIISQHLKDKKICKNDLFDLFYEARDEIKLLLKWAFIRFKSTEQYCELVKTVRIEIV